MKEALHLQYRKEYGTDYLYFDNGLCLWQGDFEMEDLQAGNKSESEPMMGQPITVQPGRESDGSQPIVLQPRSSNDSLSKQMSSAEGAVWSEWVFVIAPW